MIVSGWWGKQHTMPTHTLTCDQQKEENMSRLKCWILRTLEHMLTKVDANACQVEKKANLQEKWHFSASRMDRPCRFTIRLLPMRAHYPSPWFEGRRPVEWHTARPRAQTVTSDRTNEKYETLSTTTSVRQTTPRTTLQTSTDQNHHDQLRQCLQEGNDARAPPPLGSK